MGNGTRTHGQARGAATSSLEFVQGLYAGTEGVDIAPGLRAVLTGEPHPHAAAAEAGFARWLDALDPDAEIDMTGLDMPGFGVLRGRQGFRELWTRWIQDWKHYGWTIGSWTELGEHVLIEIQIRATGRQSEIETTWSHSQIWTVRDGKIVSWRAFKDRVAALAAIKDP